MVPTLISREAKFSGRPDIRMTDQPHREWIYRQAFHMGRHVIGYEVQKVLAAVDWIKGREPRAKVGVAGYGEGGLIAFYAAAADTRIDAVLVSGYFDSRQGVWSEPIYRNVWGLLEEFGDAEIATLIAPRGLVVELSQPPVIKSTKGDIRPLADASVKAEFARIDRLIPAGLSAEGARAGLAGGPRQFSPHARCRARYGAGTNLSGRQTACVRHSGATEAAGEGARRTTCRCWSANPSACAPTPSCTSLHRSLPMSDGLPGCAMRRWTRRLSSPARAPTASIFRTR